MAFSTSNFLVIYRLTCDRTQHRLCKSAFGEEYQPSLLLTPSYFIFCYTYLIPGGEPCYNAQYIKNMSQKHFMSHEHTHGPGVADDIKLQLNNNRKQVFIFFFSPCLKNSRQTHSAHFLAMFHDRHGLHISAHLRAIQRNITK